MWQAISYYVVLTLESLIGVFGIRLYEEPRYDVIDRIADRVEVRRYAPRPAAEVELPVGGKTGRKEAFRLLFAYISGANSSSASGKDRIAMTVPVETSETNGMVRMTFFLPAKYRRENAPKPVDARVQLVTIPDETVAVLRFSGTGDDFAERQSKLIATLAGSRWRPIGAPYTLYYDAAFTLSFLRRNEAAVSVVEIHAAPSTAGG